MVGGCLITSVFIEVEEHDSDTFLCLVCIYLPSCSGSKLANGEAKLPNSKFYYGKSFGMAPKLLTSIKIVSYDLHNQKLNFKVGDPSE